MSNVFWVFIVLYNQGTIIVFFLCNTTAFGKIRKFFPKNAHSHRKTDKLVLVGLLPELTVDS